MDLVVKENLVLLERRISLSEFHSADEVYFFFFFSFFEMRSCLFLVFILFEIETSVLHLSIGSPAIYRLCSPNQIVKNILAEWIIVYSAVNTRNGNLELQQVGYFLSGYTKIIIGIGINNDLGRR